MVSLRFLSMFYFNESIICLVEHCVRKKREFSLLFNYFVIEEIFREA